MASPSANQSPSATTIPKVTSFVAQGSIYQLDEKAIEDEKREDAQRHELYVSLHNNDEPQSAPPRVKSIARAQKLINKLKRFCESDKQLVIAGLNELDVSMYLTEITSALCDVSLLKLRDVSALVSVCVRLQYIYGNEFHSELLAGLRRQQEQSAPGSRQRLLVRIVVELMLCGVLSESENVLGLMLGDFFESVPNLSKYVASCRQGAPLMLPNVIVTWAEFDHLQTIESVAKKYAAQVFGINLIGKDNGFVYRQQLSLETQKHNRSLLEKYTRQKSVAYFVLVHEALFQQEFSNQQIKVQKGALDAESELKLPALQTLRERVTTQLHSIFAILSWPYQLRLQVLLNQLAVLKHGQPESNEPIETANQAVDTAEVSTLVQMPPDFFPKFLIEDLALVCPHLTQRYLSPAPGSGGGITRMSAPDEGEGPGDHDFDTRALESEVKWSELGERAFYEDIPDLKDVVPAPLLQQSTKKQAADENGVVQKKESGELGTASKGALTTSQSQVLLAQAAQSNPQQDSDADNDLLSLKETPGSALSPTLSTHKSGTGFTDEPSTSLSTIVPLPIDKFIESFIHFAETCGYVDATMAATVDAMVRDFFLKQLNTKVNRRKLAKAFLSTNKTDLHVLSPVCRFLGIIGQYFHDISTTVVNAVKLEFEALTDEKSPYKIEQKIKNIRFLGELCKFKLIPIGSILEIVDTLVDDFNPHHIEMLCHLFETCGRFIAGTRGADIRLVNKLVKIKRLKSSKTIPSRLEVFLEDQIAILEAACARMNGEMPALWQRAVRGEVADKGPPMKQYIEDMIWVELAERWTNDDVNDGPREILKRIRKLDWNNPQVVMWLMDAFLDIQYHVDISSIDKISVCLAKLASSQPQFVITCVDELLERLVSGIDDPDTSHRQRLLLQSKLLVELFEDKVVDSYLLVDFIYYLMGIHSAPTPFGASHFKTIFELLKIVAVNDGNFIQDVDTTLPPLEFVERLHTLPPVTPSVKYNAIVVETTHHQGADLAVVETKTGTIPNRLVEVFFNCYVQHPSRQQDVKTDFFKVRLGCYVLKQAWQSINKRSYPWKLHMILTTLIYVVSWKSHECDDRMPVELDFSVRDVAAEIHSSVAKRDINDRLQASLEMGALIAEMYPLIQSILTSSTKHRVVGSSPDSLLANFSKLVIVNQDKSSGDAPEEIVSPLTNVDEARSEESDEMVDNEDEEDEEAGDEDGEEEDFSSEDDEAGRQSQTVVQFDRELDQLVAESMEMARSTMQFGAYNRSAAAAELRLPHHLLRNKVKKAPVRSETFDDANADGQDVDVSPGGSSVSFILVTKKGSGGKYSMKSLATSADSRLAAALTKVTSDVIDDSVDRQLIKRLVMDHVDRIGAEEQRYSDSYGNRHHPHGPDDRPVIQSQRLFVTQSPGQSASNMRSATSSQRGNRRGPTGGLRKAKDKPIREARRKAVYCDDEED
eukprot:Blabericola_migrator_1__13059@NODE_87_length_14713_cov_55_061450_g78_i0_p1_GENE_NODE_87_length_14713_cov_55_061450_g78_i0NODE_87_length_14713_cov_55_061450_g78_i0_p1_ORF_typecomplete_len1448_score324_46MIF4G/PF02854_19/0_0018MIF4G/PF02854_19/5_4e23MIF4G/PF02854_19/3_3e08MIF4G/PF02854_19/5_7e03Upf2/PF04050_14/7_3e11DUF4763/PF15960_5/0_37Nop14/PF04147_12/2_9Nop14/PF04147_12/51RRN3/PF05327_11/60RRN3/PF05327_11/1_6RNA_pol_3_Rpc31/PF11705_8/1_1e04RNA_pol_3_Rpc31/PF11705_8/0_079DNA_pol_phi/PF04931_13/